MNGRAGFVWNSPQHFSRLIEDCGIPCELVTPQMLAAPFFRGSFTCLVVPTGFGNPKYSNLLPALRASSSRIRRFVERGGRLLVFGAADNRPDAYDWLPFPVTYEHDFHPRSVAVSESSVAARILDDYDAGNVECDGCFPCHGGNPSGEDAGSAVLIEQPCGEGMIVVTSIHEFPSRQFIQQYCGGRDPVPF